MIGAAIAGGFIWYNEAQKPEAASSRGDAKPVVLNEETTQSETNSGNELRVSNSNSANAITGSGDVQGNSVARPTPNLNDYSQYEKYKSEAAALYMDLQAGSDEEAKYGMTLTVNYRGRLTDGRIFDESYARKQPLSFVLGANQVIAGWEQGLVGMKVGGKRRLIVPPAVGYGDKPQGGIPANSVLVFDVELLDAKTSGPAN